MTAYISAMVIALLATPPVTQKVEPAKPANTAKAIISLESNPSCRGLKILLKDVAEITTIDSKLRKKLATIDLGFPPAPRYIREILSTRVKQAVIDAGYSPETVSIAGPERILVTSRTRTIHPRQLEQAAELVVKSAIDNLKDQSITATLRTRVFPLVIPSGRIGVDINATLRQGRLDYRFANVQVDILIDGQIGQSVKLQFSLKREKMALVTNSSLPRNTPLTKDNLHLAMVDITMIHGKLITDIKTVSGKITRRSLSANKPILIRDTQLPLLIKKGDTVQVIARTGRVMITMIGKACASGSRGDHISVINTSSGKTVRGRIRSRGVIEIN